MLPAVQDEAGWAAVVGNDAAVRPAAIDILHRMGVTDQLLDRYTTGSMPVCPVGTAQVLKLYPTVCAESAATETRALEHLHGKLPVPTPELLAEGEYENGWRYVLMSQLAGESLAPAWPQIPEAAHEQLAEAIGQMIAAMHQLDTTGLAGSLGPTDWEAFVARQRATAVERQRANGLPETWLEQIPDFLASALRPRLSDRVLLHTEIMRDHLLVDPRTWTLTGLFDFEPAMIGDGAYEFAAVGVFTARGDTHFLQRIIGRLWQGAHTERAARPTTHPCREQPALVPQDPPRPIGTDTGIDGRDLVRHRLTRRPSRQPSTSDSVATLQRQSAL